MWWEILSFFVCIRIILRLICEKKWGKDSHVSLYFLIAALLEYDCV